MLVWWLLLWFFLFILLVFVFMFMLMLSSYLFLVVYLLTFLSFTSFVFLFVILWYWAVLLVTLYLMFIVIVLFLLRLVLSKRSSCLFDFFFVFLAVLQVFVLLILDPSRRLWSSSAWKNIVSGLCLHFLLIKLHLFVLLSLSFLDLYLFLHEFFNVCLKSIQAYPNTNAVWVFENVITPIFLDFLRIWTPDAHYHFLL